MGGAETGSKKKKWQTDQSKHSSPAGAAWKWSYYHCFNIAILQSAQILKKSKLSGCTAFLRKIFIIVCFLKVEIKASESKKL